MTEARTLPIVVIQGCPVAWDPEASIDKLEAETRRLCAWYPSTRLVVFPEYYVTGFTWVSDPPGDARLRDQLAEPVPGPLTERLAKVAADLAIWLVPGTFYERGDDGAVYNTAVAISPDGAIAARYRKVFPWRPWETVAAGSEFVVFDVDGIARVGLMTCYDGWFPEVSRQLAWLGADVIVQPGATYTSDRPQELILARANAIANQLYVVNVNTAAPAGAGRSVICDAEGHALQVGDHGEAHLTEVLDIDAVARVREHGSVGLNRLWHQLDREGPGVRLPMYEGAIAPRRSVEASTSTR